MERRTLIASLGGLTASGTLAVGSGAFTSVSAQRSVTVSVADDFEALLAMEPIADTGLGTEYTGRSDTNGRTVEFELPGDDDGESTAEGLGVNSKYEFHDLLEIENRGTHPVEVFSQYNGSALGDLALVRDGGILRQSPPILDVGSSIDVGLYVDTENTQVSEYEEALVIVASKA